MSEINRENAIARIWHTSLREMQYIDGDSHLYMEDEDILMMPINRKDFTVQIDSPTDIDDSEMIWSFPSEEWLINTTSSSVKPSRFFEGDILEDVQGHRFYIKYCSKTYAYAGVFVNARAQISGGQWHEETFKLVGNIYENINELL